MQPDKAETPQQERTTTVLLKHTTSHDPSQSEWHFDWLIERPGDSSEHRMITFRCTIDPIATSTHEPNERPWIGERLPDHRAHYMKYEGPISDNRGSVCRLWSFPCTVAVDDEACVAVSVVMPHKTLDLVVTMQPDGSWVLPHA